ncbi:MAG: hypothetical protein IKX71_05770 [Bacteroidales bacterium]|nr:hypothetical protein [Bacteroidales bacterium]
MKFVKYLFIFAASAALFCACSKEVRPDPAQESAVTKLQAYQEGNETKATFDGSTIQWDANDALSVFTSGASTSIRFDKEAGNNNYFAAEGNVNLNNIYALYPYSSSASLSDGKISTTLKTTQTATPGSFAPDANLAVAYSTDGVTVNFKNAVSYIKVSYRTVAGSPGIQKITLTALNGISLSGRTTLTPVVNNGVVTDVSVSMASTSRGGVGYVELAGNILPNTDYYLVVPPVNLSQGYRLTFTDIYGNKFYKDYNADKNKAQLLRNKISATGVKNIDNYDISVTAYWRVTSASDFTGNGAKYLLVKNTSASSTGYRVFDENKTGVFISTGQPLIDKFAGGSISGLSSKLSAWKSGGSAPLFMSHYVLYCFRNAYSDDGLQFTSGASEFIQNPSDLYAFTVTGSDSKEITFKLCYKHSGVSKSTDVTMTNCYLEAAGGNAFKLYGKITLDSINGLVDVFYISKGSQFIAAVSPDDILSGAKQAVNSYTQIGFCGTEVTTVAATSEDQTTMSNCFMIKNYYLCNYPEPEAVWLYKKATRKLTFVNFYELFY